MARRGLTNIVIDLNRVGKDLAHLQNMGPDARNAQARLEILLDELVDWEQRVSGLADSPKGEMEEYDQHG